MRNISNNIIVVKDAGIFYMKDAEEENMDSYIFDGNKDFMFTIKNKGCGCYHSASGMMTFHQLQLLQMWYICILHIIF